MTDKQEDKNIKNGSQGTHEPWKHPGQSSQDPDNQHPVDKKDIGTFDQVSQTS